MAIKYIFWDSDNTLIDTFALHWAKHVTTLQKYGITLDDKYKTKIHHNNGQQNWEWLTAELGLPAPQSQYLSEIDEWYAANAHRLEFMNGVKEALDYFHDKGFKQCVVSNGRKSSVLPAHEALGTEKYFKFILCKEDYDGRKPDPAPYLAAIKRMSEIFNVQVSATECLAIEDDPLGVEAAKKAGMTTLFRPTKLVAQTSEFADYTVTNTQEFLKSIQIISPHLNPPPLQGGRSGGGSPSVI